MLSQAILIPMVPELDPKKFTFIWGASGEGGKACPAELTRSGDMSPWTPWMSARYKSAGLSLSEKSSMLASALLLCREVVRVEFREGGYCTVTFRGEANPDIIRNVLEQAQAAGRPVKFVPPSVQRTTTWVSSRGVVERPELFGRIAAFE